MGPIRHRIPIPWLAATLIIGLALGGLLVGYEPVGGDPDRIFRPIHASHEWAYHTLPYLPLCLFLTHRYAATGRWGWLALLAVAWGSQITLGHFQVQMWTGGLVMLTGLWRILADRRPWPQGLG